MSGSEDAAELRLLRKIFPFGGPSLSENVGLLSVSAGRLLKDGDSRADGGANDGLKIRVCHVVRLAGCANQASLFLSSLSQP